MCWRIIRYIVLVVYLVNVQKSYSSTTLTDYFILKSHDTGLPVLKMPFDVGGYSDWWYWGYSDSHPYTSHEMLSGEYGGAIYYTNISTEPNAMWLTNSFSYPVWSTNTTFSKMGDADTTYDVFNDPNNPCTGDDSAYSIIKNSDISVRIDYEIVNLGASGFGAINCRNNNNNKSAYIASEEYIILQTYTFINNDVNGFGDTIEDFEFYQFLHGHPGDQYQDCFSIYDNIYYADSLENYVPYNSIHNVGDFNYQITQ